MPLHRRSGPLTASTGSENVNKVPAFRRRYRGEGVPQIHFFECESSNSSMVSRKLTNASRAVARRCRPRSPTTAPWPPRRIGETRMPNLGYRTPAAIGMPAAL